jgi:hypothetical protein
MRSENAITWILVGFGLLAIGTLLYIFEVTEDGLLAIFLEIIGVVYFAIGMVLAVIHNKHMVKRMQAEQESHH